MIMMIVVVNYFRGLRSLIRREATINDIGTYRPTLLIKTNTSLNKRCQRKVKSCTLFDTYRMRTTNNVVFGEGYDKVLPCPKIYTYPFTTFELE